MKNLNNIFTDIKTPDSWKKNLYSKAYAQKKQSTPVFKRVAVGTGIAFAAATTTLTVGALTDTFNIVDVLRNGFGDDVTASKIDSGDYQKLENFIQTEDIEFKVTAFVGDSEESYTLVEARLKDSAKELDIQKLSIRALVLGEEIDASQFGTELGQYFGDVYEATLSNDENGDIVYNFRVDNYPAWIESAIANKSNLNLWIQEIIVTDSNGENKVQEIMKNTSFMPERDAVSTIPYIRFNKNITANGANVLLNEVVPSDYKTTVNFSFNVSTDKPTVDENMPYWFEGEEVARALISFKGEDDYLFTNLYEEDNYDYSLTSADSNIKLYVDDKLVEFSKTEKPFVMYQQYSDGDFKSLPTFILSVNFAPAQISDASKLRIEITEENGNVITINGSESNDETASSDSKAPENNVEVPEDRIPSKNEDNKQDDSMAEDASTEDNISEDVYETATDMYTEMNSIPARIISLANNDDSTTSLYIEYTLGEHELAADDFEGVWNAGVAISKEMLSYSDDFNGKNSSVKLTVDGKELSYIAASEDEQTKPLELTMFVDEQDYTKSSFLIELNFEYSDLENATSIIVTCESLNGTVVTSTIR